MLSRTSRTANGAAERLIFRWLRGATPSCTRTFRSSSTHLRGKASSRSKDYGSTFYKTDVLSGLSEGHDNHRHAWCKLPTVRNRFRKLGLSPAESGSVLREFISSGHLLEDERKVIRALRQTGDDVSEITDRAVTQSLFHWIMSDESRSTVSEDIRQRLSRISEAADMSHPEEWFPRARALRRKIIMHVGPTNSGKTHNALQALASARLGVYAGPLRLLAHEIFHRFNKGLILPKDASPDDPPGKHARPCNMITGEEHKIVDADAGLSSCTVEMLNYANQYDVAVVDEIQMMCDPDRGGAWTSALLGLRAKEIHLCGEDVVVPLVRSLLKDTGDEIIVNRYDRLTPLTIANRSLDGDLSRIQKGDCIVTFSRSGIFALKKSIEEATGLQCALAYGRLPPEVRNEQATLFNDPNSGYDVLVGSDALGMGLNLKIRRIIFECMHKWDGREEIELSVSQVKQIAGRAGRFGLHGEDERGGEVTTLYKQDLPILGRIMASSIPTNTKRATLPHRIETHSAIEELLPEPSFDAVFDVLTNVSRYGKDYATRDHAQGGKAAKIIDTACKDLTLADRMLIFHAPIQWRDDKAVEIVLGMLRMFCDSQLVDFKRAVSQSPTTREAFKAIELLRQNEEPPPRRISMLLQALEMMYRIAVVYLWCSQRFPTAFAQQEYVKEIKRNSEEAIEWCLRNMARKSRATKERIDSKSKFVQMVEATRFVNNLPQTGGGGAVGTGYKSAGLRST